jgi:rhodanese-related sulfurtransferase
MASHGAAREAAKLGYRNVFVMPDGIFGWVKAGKPVAR